MTCQKSRPSFLLSMVYRFTYDMDRDKAMWLF